MAGADHLDYKVDIEEWEKKHVLSPPSHLLSPKSSREKKHVLSPPSHLLSPKSSQKDTKEAKVYHFSSEGETDSSSDDNGAVVRDSRKNGSMVEGLKFMGRMVNRVTRKIYKFFSMAMKKKKKSQV